MRRNHANAAACDLDECSRGIAHEYPLVTNNYDEDDDEVPMFEPDDDDVEDFEEEQKESPSIGNNGCSSGRKSSGSLSSPPGINDDNDSAKMSDTAVDAGD